jgi:hypothetical protein
MARIAIVPGWVRFYDLGAGRVPKFLKELAERNGRDPAPRLQTRGRDEPARAAVDAVLTAYLTEQRRNSASATAGTEP